MYVLTEKDVYIYNENIVLFYIYHLQYYFIEFGLL